MPPTTIKLLGHQTAPRTTVADIVKAMEEQERARIRNMAFLKEGDTVEVWNGLTRVGIGALEVKPPDCKGLTWYVVEINGSRMYFGENGTNGHHCGLDLKIVRHIPIIDNLSLFSTARPQSGLG